MKSSTAIETLKDVLGTSFQTRRGKRVRPAKNVRGFFRVVSRPFKTRKLAFRNARGRRENGKLHTAFYVIPDGNQFRVAVRIREVVPCPKARDCVVCDKAFRPKRWHQFCCSPPCGNRKGSETRTHRNKRAHEHL